MYIFGVVNVLSIPIGMSFDVSWAFLHSLASTNFVIVYALYPESNQRTLEEMDLLFAAPTPWAWDAEKIFARLKQEDAGAERTKAESGLSEMAESV